MNFDQLIELAARRRNLFVILLGGLLYVAFIGLRDLWYPDEPDIAEVALSMFLSGDWVSPRRMGEIWVDYPPMLYWIGNLSSHLFDTMNAFTLRFSNALVAIGVAIMTGSVAARWFDQRTGLWACLALMTCVLFVYEANSYRPDMLFTLFIAAGLFLYADGTLDKPRLWMRVAAFGCLGAAMLSKGILGLLLPGLILVLWHASRREWRRLFELAPLSLVSLAVFLPWVAATADAMGWDNILYEFYAQNFARFQSGFRGHQQPFWYYLKNFWVDFTPWSWLFPAAIIWTFKSGLSKNPRAQLLLWWFGTFFVFLSFAETKRQLYMLPAFPAFALLMAPWLTTIGKAHPTRTQILRGLPSEKAIHIYALTLSLVFTGLGLILITAFAMFNVLVDPADMYALEYEVAKSLRWPLLLLAIAFVGAGAWVSLAWRQRDTRNAIRRIAMGFVGLYVVILAVVMPRFEPTKTYKPQGEWIRQQIGPDQDHIGMVYPDGWGARKRGAFGFETGGARVDLLESAEEVDAFFARYPDSLVLVQDGSRELIFGEDPDSWDARVQRELWVGKTLYHVVRREPGTY